MALVWTPRRYNQSVKNPIETCSSFRGTSCRWTNDRHCLWMGIRPSGLGLRLISLQLQAELALAGERCPFDAFPCPLKAAAGVDSFFSVAGALPVLLVGLGNLRDLKGLLLLLFVRALPTSPLESSSTSSIGACDATLFFLADLVIGPEYSSWKSSLLSEGVGEGEMTLGMAGMELEASGILKGCKEDIRITPVQICVRREVC